MNELRTALRDAGYVAVGLGVLGVQQLQVRRRELERQLGAPLGDVLGDVRANADRLLTTTIDDGVKLVEERLEGIGGLGEQVDRAVEQLGQLRDRVLMTVNA